MLSIMYCLSAVTDAVYINKTLKNVLIFLTTTFSSVYVLLINVKCWVKITFYHPPTDYIVWSESTTSCIL